MPDSGSRDRPTYSARLLQSFVELLEEYDDIPGFSRRVFESIGDRVLVEVAHQALSVALAITHDPELGLRAARRHVVGDAGAFYYVVSSSPTVRDGVEQASRYMRLINDALDVSVHYDGPAVEVRFDNSVMLPRAAIDFQVGSFYRNHVKEWLGEHCSTLTVSFAHQAPENLAEYERTFAPAKVRFNAPHVGFSFDHKLLEVPLPSADPNLHAVLVPVADQTLDRMTQTRTVTADVRRIVNDRLALGAPEIADVASELAMSMRTLARRLESEGTTFRDLVDDVRRKIAVDHVGNRDVGFSELSYRLGFSHVAAFHRAFRRWTGQTPLTYRRMAGR
ncbi:MAG TPA: AraC family transcriptional regulator ligand-binding domain-containing protein [Polyangiaceae bacterium]|jgi:AraC-like DNA-binding protein|nr:AraC family transcriptional regulator ligand-binding domain-containing protein [Polyangiaceae bacterium]